jgi:hypothetical protein
MTELPYAADGLFRIDYGQAASLGFVATGQASQTRRILCLLLCEVDA